MALQQITSNIFVDTSCRGCNFGFLTTSDGIVMFDSPHRPTDAMALKAEIEKRGTLRYIINSEPHGDHWTGNAFFDAPVIAQEGVRRRILETNIEQHIQRVSSFNPDQWLTALESLRKLDEDVFVPGHGQVIDKSYLDEQGSYIQEWKEYVRAAIERGMTKDEAIYSLTDLTSRYPMESPQQDAPGVMRMNVANLYDFLTGNWVPSNPQAPPPPGNR